MLKQALFFILATLSIGSVCGQQSTSRYYVIEMGNDQLIDLPYVEEMVENSSCKESNFSLAIKTNLLFDALSLINFELETPLSDKISLAAELICPWWTMDNHRSSSKRNRLQLINGNLEVRYWLGERELFSPLTGWFAGLYTGVGSYDLEYHAKGYQGEFFIAAGASGGYAHTINRRGNLRMEYSLGLGYLATNYHYYESEYCVNDKWHAVEQRRGRYSWFGPTRIKVSLSWLINSKCNR